MKSKIFIIAFGILILTVAAIAQNHGAEKMDLDGGSRGKIPFPHKQHQDVLGDCMLCHSKFEKQPGVINKMKSEGELKKKQVMNTLCIKCHKAEKQKENPAGPTTCSKCHIR